MAISSAIEPIAKSDAEILATLDDGFLPALLPALAQATGDMTLLQDGLLPAQTMPGAPQGGMSDAQQAAAKELALGGLRRLRDGGATVSPVDESGLRAIINWMTGARATDDYIPLLIEELAPAGEDPRAPDWHLPAGTAFNVTIIGAGMSGILAGIRLKQAGVPFTIIEKNADVGGTWYENTYPGARVDVSNAFYSYSFAQKIDWPQFFSTQQSLLDYFRTVAADFGVRDHIRFSTEVETATFDDASATWTLQLRTPDGGAETLVTQALISACGQLNRPNVPDIAGRDSFAGPSFHSARWDHSVDLKGKRVAVIGTGASAAQFIPVIAQDAAELTIYQRTPNWFVPVPTYHDDVPAGQQWLFRHVPNYAHWYRFWLFWMTTEGLLPAAIVDDAWPHPERAVSAENDMLRALLTGYIQSQYLDRPDLLAKVVPSYPPAAKRMILDNGVWAATLKRENVTLVTEPIARITESAVVTSDGSEHAADVIIYGTGFQASRFLTPMKVCGRGGIDLNEQWAGDARAYMGVVVPNFPNFFMLYGPNTNIVVNGSIIYFSECEVQYVMGCLRMLLDRKARALDCKQDVHDAYNVKIDNANRKRAWGASDVNSWYKNANGRVSQNWPFNAIEYWQQTREPSPADFAFL